MNIPVMQSLADNDLNVLVGVGGGAGAGSFASRRE